MRIDFPYPSYHGIEPFEVDERELLGIWEPMSLPNTDEPAVIARGLENPFASPRLSELARGRVRVLILIDDGTRTTPVDRVLPAVVEELRRAGVREDRISLLVALGTHRAMSDEELRQKLGACYGRFAVHQHEWQNPDCIREYGRTKDGTPVTAHRLLGEHDLVLGIGSVVPHRVKGFGGGAKIAFPGVSGKEMMVRNQWEASMRMAETVMGVAENSMRLRMEEAAKLAGLELIVNVVLDRERRIVGLFAGDVVAAHRAAARTSREVYAARMPHRADIVVIDAHPQDRDFWQSAKAAYSGTLAVREGGTLIVVAPNPEGVASNHPNVLELGYRPHAELVALAHGGGVDDLIGLAILADVAQILDHAHGIIVSPGVERTEAEKLGFAYAATVEEALAAARARAGRSPPRIAVLRHGGHILPMAHPRAASPSPLE